MTSHEAEQAEPEMPRPETKGAGNGKSVVRQRAVRLLKVLLRVGFAVYVGLCVLLVVLQRRLVYAGAHMPDPPERLAAGFQPWTEHGHYIGCKRVRGAGSCLLYLHGNGGNAPTWASVVANFDGDVFVLEYPGYGSREGNPTERSLKAAALEAFETLTNYPQRIVCGQSLGSGVAAAIISRYPRQVSHLVLIVPFTSMTDVAAGQYWFAPARLLLFDSYPVLDEWERFPGKSSVFMAGNDEVIPRAARMPFLVSTNANHAAVIVPGVGHNDIELSASDWERIQKGQQPVSETARAF